MKSTLVIKPRYSEQDLPLRLSNALEHVCILWLLLDNRSQRCKDFLDSLKELLLVGVTRYDPVIGLLQSEHVYGRECAELPCKAA